MIGVQGGEPLGPVGPERLLPRGQARIPVPVPETELPLVAPPAQLGPAELGDGVQQPVPGRARAGAAGQDRLGNQSVDQIGDLFGGDLLARADRLGGVQVEGPGEHRHPPPHGLFGAGQQLITPLQRGLQGPVVRLARGPAPGQQREPGIEPGQDLPG